MEPMTQDQGLELGRIERSLHVDASPELVFEVITSPEHLQEWWPDEATLEATPGFVGEFVFGDRSDPDSHVPTITVVDVDAPHRFSFRWVQPDGVAATADNSLLVTFELSPADGGTHLRMTETGFREAGWEVAVLEAEYHDHCSGWDHYLPRLAGYVTRLVAAG